MFLIISSFLLSQTKEFSKFEFLLPYYNYLHNGQADIDLVRIGMSLVCYTGITVLLIFLFLIFLHVRKYVNPKLTEEFSLKKWSKSIYYSFWFLIGLLIGLNMSILLFTIGFNDLFMRVIKTLPSNKIVFLLFFYIFGFLISLSCISYLYQETKHFSNRVKQMITDFYIDNFPHIRLKTNGEDISGKIDDIHNDTLIILNEGYAVKAIRWDQITSIEIEKQDEDSKLNLRLLPEITENKPWWKFW